MAQAYRMKGDCVRAAHLYRRYLEAEPDTPQRVRVEQRIEQMGECENARLSITKPSPNSTMSEEPALARDRLNPKSIPIQERAAAASRTSWDSWVPWTWIGGGALGAGAGLLVFEGAVSVGNSCEPRCSPDQVGAVKRRAAVGYGLIGAGGVAAAIGVALALLGPSEDPPATLGWLARAASGAIVGGRF
jgi:hypothetical protein